MRADVVDEEDVRRILQTPELRLIMKSALLDFFDYWHTQIMTKTAAAVDAADKEYFSKPDREKDDMQAMFDISVYADAKVMQLVDKIKEDSDDYFKARLKDALNAVATYLMNN